MEKGNGVENNIVIIGANLPLIKSVAKTLADQLEMYYLDLQGLFEFDISPMTMAQLLKHGGKDYFRKKQTGSVKYATSFENTIIAVESGVADSNENVELLDKNGLLIFIDEVFILLKKQLKKMKYNSWRERFLYNISKKTYFNRSKNIKNFVDIIVKIDNQEIENIVDKLKIEILNYYGETK